MKIPNKLKIGGYSYDVIVEQRVTEHGSSNLGTSNTTHLKIWLEQNCPPEQQDETLLHEIIEIIDVNNDFRLSHQTISTLADNLYQVLKDNGLYFSNNPIPKIRKIEIEK